MKLIPKHPSAIIRRLKSDKPHEVESMLDAVSGFVTQKKHNDLLLGIYRQLEKYDPFSPPVTLYPTRILDLKQQLKEYLQVAKLKTATINRQTGKRKKRFKAICISAVA